MKRFLIYLTLPLLFAACSHIDADEQLIYVPPTNVKRAVLIEDFTGQRCLNCPEAASEIARLQAEYGDSMVVAVGIHGGPLAFAGNATTVGLRTAEADRYVDYWGIDAFPKGLVNRQGTASNFDQWGTLVREASAQQAAVEMSVSATYDAALRQVKVVVSTLALSTLANAKLQLWLTESGIVAMQTMPDGSIDRNYLHNHVLRTSINGSWGEDWQLTEGTEQQAERTADVAADWQPARLAVVAFVYTPSGVQQVCETNVDL